jgi:hypothetical protein
MIVALAQFSGAQISEKEMCTVRHLGAKYRHIKARAEILVSMDSAEAFPAKRDSDCKVPGGLSPGFVLFA